MYDYVFIISFVYKSRLRRLSFLGLFFLNLFWKLLFLYYYRVFSIPEIAQKRPKIIAVYIFVNIFMMLCI